MTTEHNIIRAAAALGAGAEFTDIVQRLGMSMPIEKAHLTVRAAELFMKYYLEINAGT